MRAKVEQVSSQARKAIGGNDQDIVDNMMLAPPEEHSRASGSRRSFQQQVADEFDVWADHLALKSKLDFMEDMRVLKGDVLRRVNFAFDVATLAEIQAPAYECDY